MIKRLTRAGLTFLLILGFAAFSRAVPTVALTLMTNMAKITAANSSIAPTYKTNITAATMFGASMGIGTAALQSINNFGVTSWVFSLTNFGNASANFVMKIVASNVVANGVWHRSVIPSVFNLMPPMAVSNFRLSITNISPASNGSRVGFLVKASNISAVQTTAHMYLGQDGATWYGGSLGVLTNHARTNTFGGSAIGPICYLQSGASASTTNLTGFVTVLLRGPVLRITKSITGIGHPSGLTMAAGYAEPGAFITNRIWVTNAGGSYATNVKIVDSMNSNFGLVLIANIGSGLFTPCATNIVGTLRVVRFTNILGTNKLSPGRNDIIRIVVKVR